MTISSIAVLAVTDGGLGLLIALIIFGSLIGLAVSAMTPHEEWPHDILDRDDGHGWEE